MFSARRVAQMSAFFAKKNGKTINILKLMKLLYLSDRESFLRYGSPISFDNFISMDHGPALSMTLNLINGFIQSDEVAHWEEWITDRENHDVRLKRDFSENELDQLSEADIEILENVWSGFGKLNQWQLVDYTHKNCKEWKDPNHSAIPINLKDIYLALDIDEETANSCIEHIESHATIKEVLV